MLNQINGSSQNERKVTLLDNPQNSPSLSDLVELGTFDIRIKELLESCVSGGLSIIICGAGASGKSTLLNALAGKIDQGLRVLTIKDYHELTFAHPHKYHLEVDYSKGKPIESIRDLIIKGTHRHRPDRLIIGEIRGKEVYDCLRVIKLGFNGVMTTLIAEGPATAIYRLIIETTMSNEIPKQYIPDFIASSIDIIVTMQTMRDGTRKITDISEVAGVNKEIVETNSLIKFVTDGNYEGQIHGQWVSTGHHFMTSEKLKRRGIINNYVISRVQRRVRIVLLFLVTGLMVCALGVFLLLNAPRGLFNDLFLVSMIAISSIFIIATLHVKGLEISIAIITTACILAIDVLMNGEGLSDNPGLYFITNIPITMVLLTVIYMFCKPLGPLYQAAFSVLTIIVVLLPLIIQEFVLFIRTIPRRINDRKFVRHLRKTNVQGFSLKLGYDYDDYSTITILPKTGEIKTIKLTSEVYKATSIEEVLSYPSIYEPCMVFPSEYYHSCYSQTVFSSDLRSKVKALSVDQRERFLKTLRTPTRDWFDHWFDNDSIIDEDVTRKSQARLRSFQRYLEDFYRQGNSGKAILIHSNKDNGSIEKLTGV